VSFRTCTKEIRDGIEAVIERVQPNGCISAADWVARSVQEVRCVQRQVGARTVRVGG
jgi:gamma-glutamyl:cysteine ligase YbdK (ATP-grasp superfamily)